MQYIIWRARSQSHVIDSGYEVIDDITLARAEMPAIIKNISDRELSLTTWFLSVAIWASYLKPQFQWRYFVLQPFKYLFQIWGPYTAVLPLNTRMAAGVPGPEWLCESPEFWKKNALIILINLIYTYMIHW